MLLTVDLERLDIQPGHRLLDAGCGEGRHCFGAIDRGATVVGLDLDFDSMRDASKNLRARGEELGRMGAMLQGDAFHLPFRRRELRSNHLLRGHGARARLSRRGRELFRVAKPGAKVAITIPDRNERASLSAARRRVFRESRGAYSHLQAA